MADCDDNFVLEVWALWSLFALTMFIISILAISLVENIKRAASKLIITISIMLMIADLACLIWIWENSRLDENTCNPALSNYTTKPTVVIISAMGTVYLSLNQISYWLLACKYWDLSY
jgi:cyanate permease